MSWRSPQTAFSFHVLSLFVSVFLVGAGTGVACFMARVEIVYLYVLIVFSEKGDDEFDSV